MSKWQQFSTHEARRITETTELLVAVKVVDDGDGDRDGSVLEGGHHGGRVGGDLGERSDLSGDIGGIGSAPSFLLLQLSESLAACVCIALLEHVS